MIRDTVAGFAAEQLRPAALRDRFTRPLEWTPEIVRERKFAQREPALAAVLIGIVMRDDPTVLLTQRTAHLSTHSGQVAFAETKVRKPPQVLTADPYFYHWHSYIDRRAAVIEEKLAADLR